MHLFLIIAWLTKLKKDTTKQADVATLQQTIQDIHNDLQITKQAFVEMKQDMENLAKDHPMLQHVGKEHMQAVKDDVKGMVEELGQLEKMVSQSGDHCLLHCW